MNDIPLWYRKDGKELQSVSQNVIYITFILFILYIEKDLQIFTPQQIITLFVTILHKQNFITFETCS